MRNLANVESNNLPLIKYDLAEVGYLFSISCIILSLISVGLGDYILGYNFASNVATFFIYILLMFQIATGTLRFPKILLLIYGYILVHTYVVNASRIDVESSIRHFIGLVIFSLSVFTFVSQYKNKIPRLIKCYYIFTSVVATIGILQVVLFALFDYSFIPQNVLAGSAVMGGRTAFSPIIFNTIPRAVGISSEPAHYAIMILPGVYLSIVNLLGIDTHAKGYSKKSSVFIILGFLLSFSIVGYFGLLLCLLSIFSNKSKGKLLLKILAIVLFGIVIAIISQTTLSTKVSSLPQMISGAVDYEYTSSDLTGFALVSNLVVAKQGLMESGFMGTGFNSHKDTYASKIYNIFSMEQVIMELNSADAGSLFIRILSEFGLPGILVFVYLLLRYHTKKSAAATRFRTINSMSLVMIISYSARNGGYISVFLILFAALYYYTYLMDNNAHKYAKPEIRYQ